MMVIDGVTGALTNATHTVYVDFIARVASRGDADNGRILSEVDLAHGDGMCMGYHGWLEGDFGQDPIAVRRSGSDSNAEQ